MVLAGGALGSLCRYLVATAILQRFAGRFPLGTFIVNISGSFLIGLLMTLLTERFQPHPYWRLILVVGFLGGYTTFSSFEYETYLALRSGSHLIALANVVGSIAAGYLALLCGVFAAGRL